MPEPLLEGHGCRVRRLGDRLARHDVGDKRGAVLMWLLDAYWELASEWSSALRDGDAVVWMYTLLLVGLHVLVYWLGRVER